MKKQSRWLQIASLALFLSLNVMQESALAETAEGISTVTSPEELLSEESAAEASGEELSEEMVSYETAIQLFSVSQGIKIQWNPVPGVSRYFVYRKTGDREFCEIASVAGGEATEYVDRTTQSGVLYEYTVYGQAEDGRSYGYTTGRMLYLAQPFLSSVVNGVFGVTVKWDEVPGAQGYHIYRKSEASWEKIGTVTGESMVKYSDKGVTSGTAYSYTVQAFSDTFSSSYDTEGTGICYLAKPVLERVTNGVYGVTVKWVPTAGAQSYYIYRKSAGGGWKNIGIAEGGSTSSYSDKSASSGFVYTYTVRACCDGTLSGYDASGKSIKYLARPVLSGISNGISGVVIQWNQTAGAEGYYIYRKQDSDSWKRIGRVSGADTVSYTDTAAQPGTNYIYTVRAYSGETASGYDPEGKSIKRLTEPTISTLINGVQGVTIGWNQVQGASGYYVFRKTGNGAWRKIGTINNGQTVKFSDKSASSGTSYLYTVRAFDGTIRSSYNAAGKSIKYLSKPVLSFISNAVAGVTIKWNEVTGADGYDIYRKSGSGSWKKVGSVKGIHTVSYTDSSVASGTAYTYTVRAYSGNTRSGYDAAGKTVKYLAAPALLSAAGTSSSVSITWGQVSGAEGYYVYRRQEGGNWKKIGTVKGKTTVSYLDKSSSADSGYLYTVRAYSGKTVSGYDGEGIKAPNIHYPSEETIRLANSLDKTVRGYGQGKEVDGQNRPIYALNMQKSYGKYNATFIGSNPNAVSFIFTCGWERVSGGRANTEKVLDILKTKGVKAAFFVTHEYASRNPSIVQRMINEGHILGSHGYSHPANGIPSLSISEQIEDTMKMQNYIRNTFGYEMSVYNFSSSYWSESSMALISGMGYKICFYTVNYRDWLVDQQLPADQAYAHLVNSMHPGAIYFLHTVSDTNVAILGKVIDEAVSRGYTVTLPI